MSKSSTISNQDLEAEIAYRLSIGCHMLSVEEFGKAFQDLGYRLDRSMDCRSIARYLESGRTYPACSTSVREMDTGLGFANVDARRDDNFKRLQVLRQEIFAVSRNAILEV